MEKNLSSISVKQRDIWIDNIKVFACVLVVLGHLFQSMTTAQILPENKVYLWFNDTIYYFHVPLFFICSGYVFQKYSKVDSWKGWKRHVVKKTMGLGIPYFAFSTLTWIIKTVFSGTVNTQMSHGLLYTLFISPASPYWYLYCLFLIFFITPTFKDKKRAGIGVGLAILMKIISIMGACPDIYAVSTVFANEIWFISGMCLAVTDYPNINFKKHKSTYIFTGAFFFVMSILVQLFNVKFVGIEFVMGILACIAVVGIFSAFSGKEEQNAVMNFLTQYTMPVFLMHTIFAAPVRVVLIKLDIYSPIIHSILGIGISIIGPVAAAVIMKHIPILNFFLYPAKYIRKK